MDSKVFDILYASGCYFLPVVRGAKDPAVVGGSRVGVTNATRKRGAILEWVKSHDLGCRGGLVEGGGEKYLVIVDADVKRENGLETLEQLQEEYGKLPRTLTVSTRSGGKHFYFFSKLKIGTNQDVFRKKMGQSSGIDIRGHMGYAVCPPSGGYTVSVDGPIAELPVEWSLLLQSLVLCREKSSGGETFSIPPHVEEVQTFNERESVHEALEKLGYRRVSPNTYCHPFGATSPSNVSVLKNQSFLKHGSEYISWHFGAHDMVQGGPHDSFDLHRLIEYGGDWDAAVRGLRIKRSDGVFFRASEVPRTRRLELVEGHLREEDVVILAGFSETQKTFWAMDLCFSLATGLPFLDRFPVRGGGVQSAMILTESRGDFFDRREAWIKFRSERSGRSAKDLRGCLQRVWTYFQPLVFTSVLSMQTFNGLAGQYGEDFQPKVWVLDHFSNNYDGDENSNSEVAKFLKVLRRKAMEDKAAICVLHHPPKGDTSKMRGASVLLNNLPVSYTFERRDGQGKRDKRARVKVTQEKCSYHNGFQDYYLKANLMELYLDDSLITPRPRFGLALEVDDEEQRSAPREDRGEALLEGMGDLGLPISATEAASILKVSKPTVREVLAALVEEGRLTKEGTEKNPKWRKVGEENS